MDDPLTLKVPNPETGDCNHWQIVALLAFIAVMVVFAATSPAWVSASPWSRRVALGLVLLVTLAYFAPAPLTLRRVGPRIEGSQPGHCPPEPAGWWCAATRT